MREDPVEKPVEAEQPLAGLGVSGRVCFGGVAGVGEQRIPEPVGGLGSRHSEILGGHCRGGRGGAGSFAHSAEARRFGGRLFARVAGHGESPAGAGGSAAHSRTSSAWPAFRPSLASRSRRSAVSMRCRRASPRTICMCSRSAPSATISATTQAGRATGMPSTWVQSPGSHWRTLKATSALRSRLGVLTANVCRWGGRSPSPRTSSAERPKTRASGFMSRSPEVCSGSRRSQAAYKSSWGCGGLAAKR